MSVVTRSQSSEHVEYFSVLFFIFDSSPSNPVYIRFQAPSFHMHLSLLHQKIWSMSIIFYVTFFIESSLFIPVFYTSVLSSVLYILTRECILLLSLIPSWGQSRIISRAYRRLHSPPTLPRVPNMSPSHLSCWTERDQTPSTWRRGLFIRPKSHRTGWLRQSSVNES